MMKLMTMMTTTSQQGTTILVQFSSLNLDAVRWALESIKDLFENNNKNFKCFHKFYILQGPKYNKYITWVIWGL